MTVDDEDKDEDKPGFENYESSVFALATTERLD